VSGDSISDQQKTLSNFLSSQQENTEISFFAASKTQSTTDYRRAICRQLGDHEAGSFVRSLQQLLSDPSDGLKADAGPYLVCITQADLLDSSFLQELWDWVMHAQQAEPGIHLNIILFGKSSWATKSQEWLPMNNSHKPVLLSSQSVNPIGFDVNALEALMADKTSWFGASNQPLVANKWFIGSVLSIFLSVFIGLMTWQYPIQLSALSAHADLSNNQAFSSTDIQSGRQAIVDENLTASLATLANIETTSAPQLEFVRENESVLVDETTKQDSLFTETALVRSWSDSLAISNSTELSSMPDNKTSSSTIQSALGKGIKSGNVEFEQTDKVVGSAQGDFQVPDIISVEELAAKLDTGLNATVSASVPAKEQASTQQVSKQIASEDSLSVDYKFDENTLLSIPADSVVLQISGIQNPIVLENYLNNNNLKSSTWVYQTQRYGGPWYVVLYRQTFESMDIALNQLSSLPEDVRSAQPFAKSILQIQQEINRR
jgi:DamX protein